MENMEVTCNWKHQRVFVTGATGIVGSWLVKRLLDEGAYVAVLIRDWDPQSELIRSGAITQTTVINGALEEYATLERAINEHEIDTVFHLGAQTIVGTALRNPLPTFNANIAGTYHLLEVCRIHRGLVKRIVVASSDKVYGDVDTLPYTEDLPLKGRHPYDVSKCCTDMLAMAYAYTYELPILIARCGNIYGGGDLNWSRIVPGTIRSLLHDQRPILRSDGTYTRDYIFIQDVVEAYLLLASRASDGHLKGQAFNFASGHHVSVLEITGIIQSLLNREDLKPMVLNQARSEIKKQILDTKKSQQLLNWEPKYRLQRGLKLTVDWYKNFFNDRSTITPS